MPTPTFLYAGFNILALWSRLFIHKLTPPLLLHMRHFPLNVDLGLVGLQKEYINVVLLPHITHQLVPYQGATHGFICDRKCLSYQPMIGVNPQPLTNSFKKMLGFYFQDRTNVLASNIYFVVQIIYRASSR